MSEPCSPSRGRGFWLCGILVATAVGAEESLEELIVCPRLSSAPGVDGKLSDGCWKSARETTDFTRPLSAARPRKRVSARIGFDERFLYIAFDSEEPSPERIRPAAGEHVWRGDCVEVWVRAGGDALEHLQFILGPRGARESYARGKRKELDGWLSGAEIGERSWTAELAIPWKLLELKPEKGALIELKLGRQDYTQRPVGLSTWPPASPYSGGEGLKAVYLEEANLLPDPLQGWGFTRGDSDLSTHLGGELVFKSPGRYATAQKRLRLWPGCAYRLEALVKSDCPVYLRARVGRKGTPYTADVRHSRAYRPYRVPFFTDPDGRVLLILGCPGEGRAGTARIRALRLVREARREVSGPRVRIEPGRPVRAENRVSSIRATGLARGRAAGRPGKKSLTVVRTGL